MLRNHFSIALRHLAKNRMHAFINIAGLSAGMAVSILIALWIIDECSYDKFNHNCGECCRRTSSCFQGLP